MTITGPSIEVLTDLSGKQKELAEGKSLARVFEWFTWNISEEGPSFFRVWSY